MTILLDQRDDGSLALYYDGDLQFDSRDEHIYHEALALPALALAERRQAGPLRALVCGGGDGLVARELLTSPRLERLELVDNDPVMLELARGALVGLNGDSLRRAAGAVTLDDAWAYVERAGRTGRTYDLIVVDLTVPQDRDGARFHTIDWYDRLARLLGEAGLLAVNGVSPSTRADAYWSIYNSLRAAGLAPRPYRVALPSFTAHGYGDDWGFLLASPRPIAAAELDDDLLLAGSRRALRDAAHLRRLFSFPAASAARRTAALPSRLGSGILLHYLYNSVAIDAAGGGIWEGLTLADDDAPLPAADDGTRLLPPELRSALSAPVGARPDEETLFRRVVELMPALHRHQTRDMIAAFLESPERFLEAVDLPGLVERLLRRAAELPRRLVAELRLLRAKLRAFAGDHAALLRLGMRIVTVVTLVVILANLLYPDNVYGKGSEGGGSGSGGESVSLARTSRSAYDPRATAPDLATNGGYRNPGVGRGVSVDEVGTAYPARRYRYSSGFYGRRGYSRYRSGTPPAAAPTEDQTAYRLTPETDILSDGKVVVLLADDTYLLLEPDVSTVIDGATGAPLLFLTSEPAQIWRAAKEIDRQRLGLRRSADGKQAWLDWLDWLEFAPWRSNDDQRELETMKSMADRLEAARATLGAVPDNPPSLPAPPVPGAFELFSGAWLLPDGSALALRLPDGLAFMDGKGWYRDAARTQALAEPYPAAFKAVVARMLETQVRNHDATFARLEGEVRLAGNEVNLLLKDKAEYEGIARTNSPETSVEYGSNEIPLREALRRTNDDLARAQQRQTLLQAQFNRLPDELNAARRAITMLGS